MRGVYGATKTWQRVVVVTAELGNSPALAARAGRRVRIDCGGSRRLRAGGLSPGERARQAAFKRDRENLRGQLQADFFYDPKEQTYILTDPGPFARFELSEPSLQAIRLLSQTFVGDIGERVEVTVLLAELIERLSPDARRSLEGGPLPIEVDVFQGVDVGPIGERVWERVQRAARQGRKLGFNYSSPQQEDRLPRYHEVAPYQIQFRRGHWYLYAYDYFMRNPYGAEWRDSGYKRFRLHYIQDDERLQVLPSKLPPNLPRPPRYRVHYRLLPALGRGTISSHFDEMQVTRFEDGSAEVTGYTGDEWEAARILLGYGENCIVLGGEELRRLMEQRVRAMGENYLIDNRAND